MIRITAIAAGFLIASAAQAHDFWIEPSTFRPQPGSIVAVHLWVGENFAGDPVKRQLNNIDRFVLRQDGIDAPIGGANNIDPAGQFRMPGSATAMIGYSSHGATTESGERLYRYAKALLTGTGNAGSAMRPLGFAYEIVPGDDPATARPFKGQVLHNGKPLANALVEALWRDDPAIRLSARSDAQGGFVLALPKPGVWLIKSMHVARAGFFAAHDWDSLWASLTFEAP